MSSLRTAATEKKKSLDTDANGDGAGDVVVVCRDRVRVMLSMGQGLFAAQADLLPGPKKGPAAALADA